MQTISANQAKTMFSMLMLPATISGADLWSGFAIVKRDDGALNVVVRGKHIASTLDYSAAKRAGEVAANRAR